MSDYGTIRIPREEYERHNERRQEMGLTWEQYINGEAPDAPEVSVDYAEIERRCGRAVEDALPNR
jgi:hypothetical protein